mmetsp:Transcript_33738/g.105673  ORF Transcript_33738/g.105673 Transcript_33738/m.105673 type:complete len:252 (+) Transcript_33738:1969-2724(+)
MRSQVEVKQVLLLHAVLEVVGTARDVVRNIPGHACSRCSVDCVSAEVAVVDEAVLEVGPACDIPHHVQVQGVAAHDVLLPHAQSSHAPDVALRPSLADKVPPITCLLALLVPLQREAAGEERDFCGVLLAAVMAVVKSSIKGDPLARYRFQPPDLVLVVTRLVCPGRGHDHHLLPGLPVDRILQLEDRCSRGGRGREARPGGSVADTKHLEQAPGAHRQALCLQGVAGLCNSVAITCEGNPHACGHECARL